MPQAGPHNDRVTPQAPPSLLDHPLAIKAGRIALVLLLIVVSWLAWRTGPGPEISTGTDKFDHLAAFAALAVAAVLGWRRPIWTFLGLLAYGVLIELVQSQIPGRTAEAADVAADALGIALGLVGVALAGWWTRRR